MTEYAVEIDKLTFAYAGARRPSLRNVNLRFRRGETTALIGPTGAGKSTLYGCLMGLIPHVLPGRMAGRVIVDGMDTRTHTIPELAQHIGIVFQDPEMQIFCLTVEEELAFGPENLGLPPAEIRARIREATRIIELGDLLEREPATLSGGQKQQVAIGAVWTMLPDVLIMDEPTSNLDPEGSIRVLELVRRLNREYGKTILIAEHKIDDVAKFADSVFVLHDGQVMMDGSVRDVFCRTDELHSVGLVAPSVTELAHRLRGASVPIEQLPITMEEAIPMFCQLFAQEVCD